MTGYYCCLNCKYEIYNMKKSDLWWYMCATPLAIWRKEMSLQIYVLLLYEFQILNLCFQFSFEQLNVMTKMLYHIYVWNIHNLIKYPDIIILYNSIFNVDTICYQERLVLLVILLKIFFVFLLWMFSIQCFTTIPKGEGGDCAIYKLAFTFVRRWNIINCQPHKNCAKEIKTES